MRSEAELSQYSILNSQISAELSFVFDPLSWFLVPGSVVRGLKSEAELSQCSILNSQISTELSFVFDL